MAYKDLEKKQEATRERVRRYREKAKALQNKVEGVTLEGVTEQGVTSYPAIIYALTDPIKRKKLEAIIGSLSRRGIASQLYYGCGRSSVPFDIVGDLLDTVKI